MGLCPSAAQPPTPPRERDSRKMTDQGNPMVDVNHLVFSYETRDVLRDINIQLYAGQRMLLIGANGAGKSTLLRVLGGRHMFHPDEAAMILGRNCFHDTRLNLERSYLDTNWGMRTVAFAGYGVPLQADIPVRGMMTKLQDEYPERRDALYELLGIDPTWRMHALSDGQRRRVQLMIGLVRPFKVLLMDEITVSLDVVVRQDLLQWLRRDATERGACIIYATHIFDGLDDWPTNLMFLGRDGKTKWQGPVEDLELYQQMRAAGEPSPMLRIACKWLRDELHERKEAGLANTEGEAGEAASTLQNKNAKSTISGGGFAPGRMAQGY